MAHDDDPFPAAKPLRVGRYFTEAAREAAKDARAAKREQSGPFGQPELFVTVMGKAFNWELRRFGGIVLQRSAETFGDAASAREAGEAALAVLRTMPDLPMSTRTRTS